MTTKIVYSYHPVTGEYTGPTTAYESPLEPGVYHYPARSSTTEPPAYAQREVAVWQADQWTVMPDWRGAALFRTADGQAVQVNEIGQVPADIGATDIEPPAPQDGHELNWVDDAWVLEEIPPPIEPEPDPVVEAVTLDPLEKLKQFLLANQDVAALLANQEPAPVEPAPSQS